MNQSSTWGKNHPIITLIFLIIYPIILISYALILGFTLFLNDINISIGFTAFLFAGWFTFFYIFFRKSKSEIIRTQRVIAFSLPLFSTLLLSIFISQQFNNITSSIHSNNSFAQPVVLSPIHSTKTPKTSNYNKKSLKERFKNSKKQWKKKLKSLKRNYKDSKRKNKKSGSWWRIGLALITGIIVAINALYTSLVLIYIGSPIVLALLVLAIGLIGAVWLTVWWINKILRKQKVTNQKSPSKD